jgi:hypothetical protein
MTNRDWNSNGGGQVLQMVLPSSRTIAVATTGIGTNQQSLGLGISISPQHAPPALNASDGELRSVVRNAHVD